MRIATRIVGVLALTAGMAAGVQTAGAAAVAPRAIDTLAQSVAREQSLRQAEDVQRGFAQLAQFGRWGDMGALFAQNGTLQWGDQTVTGRAAITNWLKTDAGAMNGVQPGSLDTMIIDDPIANLSADGLTAQVRWDGIRFMGDGKGNTRIDGGIYENDYVQEHGLWKIATLHFYLQYQGDYANGWRNVNGQQLPDVPYHFTPTSAGVPLPAPSVPAPRTHETAAQLAAQIARLNDEDAVRNLQNSYGYYVDRRMWDDVVDLFAPGATATIGGLGTFHGSNGVRQAMERSMGPAGLTQSALNDHPLFDVIVDVSPDGKTAVARGTQLGMMEDPTTKAASWQFAVFRNTFVNQGGIWKLKDLNITPLITATYADGWGNGGIAPPVHTVPAFVDVSRQNADQNAQGNEDSANQNVADLTRRLDRSEAYDGAENVNNAYAIYLTDLNFGLLGQLMAPQGNKESPFIGYYVGPARVTEAGARYGATPILRSSIPIHWEPQPVILVSHDGRSADLRSRLFQFGTSITNASSFYAGMYNDQFVLENGVWQAWDVTIDEPYMNSAGWTAGWAGVQPRDPNAPPPPPNPELTQFPPDLALTDMGAREAGFQGGTGTFIAWPDILPMWFDYRNPVSGRVPEHYQSDCTACVARPDWSMTNYGYELPPNGPEIDGQNVNTH